jgi:hypothetical protein
MPRRTASRLLCPLLAACLIAFPVVRAQPAQEAPVEVDVPATASASITVVDENGEPLEGVEVVLGTTEGEIVTRAITDGDGVATFEGLSHGYRQVAFRWQGDAFVANRVLLLSPDEELEATFELGDFTAREKDVGLAPGQTVPLLGEPAVGVATLDESYGPTGWAWFRTGKGVAVLIGSGALLVGGIVALTDAEDEFIVSPSEP